MGNLHCHPVDRLRAHYSTNVLVETGLGPQAVGLRCALSMPFTRVYSVEGLPAIALDVARKMEKNMPQHQRRWEILTGDSAEVMPDLLARYYDLKQPAFFWLDAHYPGHYDGDGVSDTPLLTEVRAIVGSERDHTRDVILADDWRIYGGKGYGAGPLPKGAKGVSPGNAQDALDIIDLLEPTHHLYLDRRDGGYLVALPKTQPVPKLPATYAPVRKDNALL